MREEEIAFEKLVVAFEVLEELFRIFPLGSEREKVVCEGKRLVEVYLWAHHKGRWRWYLAGGNDDEYTEE